MRLRPGNAGPKGDDNAEIRTVLLLWLRNEVIVEKYNFGRDKVIDSAVIKSLELLKRNFLNCAVILLVYRFIFLSLHPDFE
jgi:hypothetical protein